MPVDRKQTENFGPGTTVPAVCDDGHMLLSGGRWPLQLCESRLYTSLERLYRGIPDCATATARLLPKECHPYAPPWERYWAAHQDPGLRSSRIHLNFAGQIELQLRLQSATSTACFGQHKVLRRAWAACRRMHMVARVKLRWQATCFTKNTTPHASRPHGPLLDNTLP